ncbi:hypothetical protein DAEQUDRAFT_758684 [Daedalea quercina L-15889]|uniref:Uncharacterized protein n=1 Tax=Daedalea quercina L-15889 TaxID=1314783 RepID=A0A165N6B9_9APHY|nr:hypothetical protein DAEQUDRAFT_758684 [Daedalea quercina L-15889]
MHLQSLGAFIAGALAAVSQSQLYCQMRGKHVGATCPVDFNNVATVVGRMSDKMIGFGHALADVPVVAIVGGIASGMMGITYDVNGVPVPYHDEVFLRWYMYPPLYPPGDPYARMMRTYAEDVRKWSATTDLIVVPDRVTDLIVWVPPHERLRLLMPPPVDLTELIDTVFQADSTQDDSESNLASLRLLLGFYALTFVSASLAIASLLGLEPARDARRGATMGDKLGVSAVLDFIRLALWKQVSTYCDTQQPVRYEVTSMNRRERRDAVRREHALMAGPRPLIAYDLANWSPLPRLDNRPLLFVHQHGSVPNPFAIARPPMRSRTWSSMTVTEARPAPSSRPMSNASQYEDETLVKHTLLESKALLRRQAPGIRLFGLWKSRVRRHAELRALRDEMGEDVARRHAQEGLEVLRQNLRSMMGVPGQPFVQADN